MTPEQGGKLEEHGVHTAEAGTLDVSVNDPISECPGELANSRGGQSTGLGDCRPEASRR